MLTNTLPHTCRRKASRTDTNLASPSQEQFVEKLIWLVEDRVISRLDMIFAEIKKKDSRDCSVEPNPERAIRLPEVLHLTGLSRSTWYALLNPNDPSYDPTAPKPFKLGRSPHSPSVWWAWQIIAYLEAKSATRINA